MKYQKQPNRWSCLPTAFAMALDIPVEEVFEFCGHDGSATVFPDCVDPHCRQSFHIQEMIDLCYFHQKLVTQIDCVLSSANIGGQQYVVKNDRERVLAYMREYHGVLVGSVNGHPHAVVWVGHIVDPDNVPYDVDNFDIRSFFIIKSI